MHIPRQSIVMSSHSSQCTHSHKQTHSFVLLQDKSIHSETPIAGLFKLIFIFCGGCVFFTPCFLLFHLRFIPLSCNLTLLDFIKHISIPDSFQCPTSIHRVYPFLAYTLALALCVYLGRFYFIRFLHSFEIPPILNHNEIESHFRCCAIG